MKTKLISKIYKIALVGVLVFGQSACSDFLTEKAPSNLTPTSFYTIPDHAEAAIASVYADLRFMGNGAGIFSANWQLLEALTGTSTTETAQNFFLLVKEAGVVGDPETTPLNQGGGNSAFSQGMIWHNYPKPTIYMLGLQVAF